MSKVLRNSSEWTWNELDANEQDFFGQSLDNVDLSDLNDGYFKYSTLDEYLTTRYFTVED